MSCAVATERRLFCFLPLTAIIAASCPLSGPQAFSQIYRPCLWKRATTLWPSVTHQSMESIGMFACRGFFNFSAIRPVSTPKQRPGRTRRRARI